MYLKYLHYQKHVYLHILPLQYIGWDPEEAVKDFEVCVRWKGNMCDRFFLITIDYRNELNNIWPHTKR
jgi:hypothetical protein